MSKKKFSGSVGGKGYYIALVLCAAAIGISGFLYYRNENKPDPSAGNVEGDLQDHQAVIATNPDGSVITESTPAPTESKELPFQTVAPVEGQTVAVYAMDSLTYNQTTRDWRVHNGMDIAAEAGTEVRAAADAEVYSVYEDETMGMTVVLRHEGGYTTRYASLAEQVSVTPGDKVTAGQAIGTVGNTALLESAIGDHVHFSVSCDGVAMDPEVFLSGE